MSHEWFEELELEDPGWFMFGASQEVGDGHQREGGGKGGWVSEGECSHLVMLVVCKAMSMSQNHIDSTCWTTPTCSGHMQLSSFRPASGAPCGSRNGVIQGGIASRQHKRQRYGPGPSPGFRDGPIQDVNRQ